MTPWETLDRATTPAGNELVLRRRGDEYVIRVDGKDLMGSRAHASEEALAKLTCEAIATRPTLRILIGGLGMGFTVRAALDALPREAQVDVAELLPAVVRWNRGPLSALAKNPLADRRTHVLEGDVVDIITSASGIYDAILLDVDNGPEALTTQNNARLYSLEGLASAARALKPGGTLAVWSAFEDAKFTKRLATANFNARTERVRATHNGGSRHTLWLATSPSPKSHHYRTA